MRIIAGDFKGQVIAAPKGQNIRPTGEKVRSAIFNTLYSRLNLSECTVADICCGTGALGLEALSRGAKYCSFVDLDIKAVMNNINKLEIESNFSVFRGIGQKIKLNKKADVIFLDPPYYNGIAEEVLKNYKSIGLKGSLWVVEVENKHKLEFDEEIFKCLKERRYGHSYIYLLEQLEG